MKKTSFMFHQRHGMKMKKTFSEFTGACPGVISMSLWQWSMNLKLAKNWRGIAAILRQSKVVSIEMLRRKAILEVRVRKR